MASFQIAVAPSGAHIRPDVIYRGAGHIDRPPATQMESVISDATRSALVFHVPGSYIWLIPTQGDATLLTVTCQLWRGPSVTVRPTARLDGPGGAKATTTMPNTFSTWEDVAVAIPILAAGLICFTVERPALLVPPYLDCGNVGGWVLQNLPVNGVIQDRTIRAVNPRRVEVRFPTSNAVVFS